jgi:hypothetical protein
MKIRVLTAGLALAVLTNLATSWAWANGPLVGFCP